MTVAHLDNRILSLKQLKEQLAKENLCIVISVVYILSSSEMDVIRLIVVVDLYEHKDLVMHLMMYILFKVSNLLYIMMVILRRRPMFPCVLSIDVGRSIT
jgi:hypothetical protein